MSDSPDLLPRDRYLPTGELLGEGGMAKVWRVWHRDRGSWCAVKILRARFAAISTHRRRFLNEANILMRLQHRNVVAALEVGEGEFPFLVMEVADGGNIHQWVQRHGPMPPQMAVGVAIQVCKGLAAAHRIGVVHRDIKPHNVLINRKGVCKISDFGIARIPRADGSVDIPEATVQGADAMGTLGYMAPEQRSDPKRADPRTDVYAIAATLVDLLTGRPQMNLFMAGQDPAMLAEIPEVLRPILMRSAEYDPANRFAEVRDLALALHQIRDALPAVPAGVPGLADGLPPEPPPPLGAWRTIDSGEGKLDDLEVPTFMIRTATELRAHDALMYEATPDTVPGSGAAVPLTRSPPSAPPPWTPSPAPHGAAPPGRAAPRGGVAVQPEAPVPVPLVRAELAPLTRPRQAFDEQRRNAPRTPESIPSRSPSASWMPRPITFNPEDEAPRRTTVRWTIVVACGAGVTLGFWWMWWWVSTADAQAAVAQRAFEAALVADGPVIDQLAQLGADRGRLSTAHDAVTHAASPAALDALVPQYFDVLRGAREQVEVSRAREVIEVDRRIQRLEGAARQWQRAYRSWAGRCDQLAGRIADLLGARCPAPAESPPLIGDRRG